MDQALIFWTIIGMAVVTYLPRLLPALFLSGRNLRPIIASWLRLVAPAVLAAMLIPSLLVKKDSIVLGFDNLYLWAALIAFPVAWKWNSLCMTVAVGMGAVALGRYCGWGT